MVSGCHLSDNELAVLGVKRIPGNRGQRYYIVPCDVCGKKIQVPTYNTMNFYRCLGCEKERAVDRNRIKKLVKERIELQECRNENVDFEHYHRFESAVENLSPKYYFAIEQAEKFKEKFDSVPEVLACVELLYIGARVIAHQKVGSYTVDFCLPDEKVVVEIDGKLYHSNIDKEFRRDLALKNMLGSEWEIKHIPAETLKSKHAAFGRSMRKYLEDRRFDLGVKKRSGTS